MREKNKKGRSLVIGSCGAMNSWLAVTFGAKLAYSSLCNPNKHFKPILTTLGKARYSNVLFVEDCVGDFRGGVYSRICEALGYDYTGSNNPFGRHNPLFMHIGRPRKIIDDGMLEHVIEFAERSTTDTIVFPYFSTFSRESHMMQDRIDNTICVVDFLTDKGFDVIYTTPWFDDDDLIKDGTWPRNSFFKAADFSLFVEDNEFDDKKVLHRLVLDEEKPYSITEPVLDRLAILDRNDMTALGETLA